MNMANGVDISDLTHGYSHKEYAKLPSSIHNTIHLMCERFGNDDGSNRHGHKDAEFCGVAAASTAPTKEHNKDPSTTSNTTMTSHGTTFGGNTYKRRKTHSQTPPS